MPSSSAVDRRWNPADDEDSSGRVRTEKNRPAGPGSGVMGEAMRKLAGGLAMALCALIGLAGCGSDAGDRLVLTFEHFTGEGIDQPDVVFDTHAEIDICPFFCLDQGDSQPTTEPFTHPSFSLVKPAGL